MKKPAAALLFIPLFFVFSFMHEYRFPGTFSTPSHTATADNWSSDIYAQNNSDQNSFFNWQNYKNSLQNALAGHLGVKTTSNETSDHNQKTVTARENQPWENDTFTTPGTPNTGGESSTNSSTQTYTTNTDSNTANTYTPPPPPVTVTPTVTPPPPPPTLTPPTTISTLPSNTITLTTFPQSSPPPPPPSPTPQTSTSSGQTNTQTSTTTTTTSTPPITPPVTLTIPTSTTATPTPETESSSATVSTPPVTIPPISIPPILTPPPPSTTTQQSTTTSNNNSSAASSSTQTSTTSSDQNSNQTTDQSSNGNASSSTNSTPPPAPAPEPTGSVFDTGGVTLRFDDGWQSQYDVALPAMQAAGIKGTFYIVTRQLLDQDFSGFMSIAEVKQLHADGEEVGAHTQTHPHLPTLSADQQKQEIDGSKADLAGWGINALTFSYPYGEYTNSTMQIVKDAGFTSAVSTIESAATKNSDRFQIEGPSLQNTDTPASVEQMIQTAVKNHQWLVLTFHRIDTSGDQYSMTPANFKQIINYIQSHQIPTFTVSQGAASLAQ